jgi:hypothetical protein
MRLSMHVLMTILFALAGQGRYVWLVPLRDCLGLYVWAAGLAGTTVRWKDRQLTTRY